MNASCCGHLERTLVVTMILSLLNRKNACFSMPLKRLFSSFKYENVLEFRSFASEPDCKVVASALNIVIFLPLNIAKIMVATF